MDRVIFVFLH